MAERKTLDADQAPEGFTYLENPNNPAGNGYYPDAVADALMATSADQAWKAPNRIPKTTPDPAVDGVPVEPAPEGN